MVGGCVNVGGLGHLILDLRFRAFSKSDSGCRKRERDGMGGEKWKGERPSSG